MEVFLKACFSEICDWLYMNWPWFISNYLWTYRHNGIQQFRWTGRKFSEAVLSTRFISNFILVETRTLPGCYISHLVSTPKTKIFLISYAIDQRLT